MKLKPLEKWKLTTEELAEAFMLKYFPECTFYWIGNQVGGVIDVADHCLGLQDIVEAMTLLPPGEELMQYYDYREELYFNDNHASPVNLNYWLAERNKVKPFSKLKKCKACNATIYWAETQAGKLMPVVNGRTKENTSATSQIVQRLKSLDNNQL